MTRPFSFYDQDGEYDHMAQLSCTFRFVPTDVLRAAGEAERWSFDLELEAFFEQALAMPGSAVVRACEVAPLRLEVAYSDV